MTEAMQQSRPAKPSVGDWLLDEVVSYSVLAAYLFVCFAALLYFKSAILEAAGVSFAPWGFAAVKALIVAKFMLVMRRFDRHPDHDTRPLIVPTLNKSLATLVLLVVLMVIEETIVGLIHGRAIWQALSELGGGTLHQRIGTIVILLLILMPMFAFRAVGDRIGQRKLVRMFFARADRE